MGRHDRNARAMAIGLHTELWDHWSHCIGAVDLMTGLQFDWDELDATSSAPPGRGFGRSQNQMKLLGGMYGFTSKNIRGVMDYTREIIRNNNWRRHLPDRVELRKGSTPSPNLSKWVGLTGDGICAECENKPARYPAEYIGADFDSLMRMMIRDAWIDYTVSDAYQKRQVRELTATSFFTQDPNGIEVMTAYAVAGSGIRTAFECLARAMDAHAHHRMGKRTDARQVAELLGRHRDLPDITEIGLDRDWCPTCTGNLVTISEDPFDLI